MPDDPLAEISGIKPKVLLQDGEDKEVSSMTSNSVYKVKRTWDHYYCTCPAWRNQSKCPINARTCKHLKSLLGDPYEEARLKLMNPSAFPTKKVTSKPGRGKKRALDDDEDEPKAKKTRQSGKPGSKANDKDKEDESDTSSDEEEAATAASGKKKVPELLLANKWDLETGLDPSGWWISEKLDGVRTFFDGKTFLSRLGNPFTPPKWFFEKLPKDITLDGELFGGRGKFQDTVSIVKTANSPHWQGITFQLFDVPSLGDKPFEERINYLQKMFGPQGTHAAAHIVVVNQVEAKDKEHVLQHLKEVETLGGEGVMLRRPASLYEGRRSGTLLKVKTFYDAEAIVTGYAPGKGKHKGSTGALKCKMASGKACYRDTFNVGTGLSDKQRQKPPKIGAIITYRFQELTRDGVPRFPSFIGEAIDKSEPKDAEVPEHRKTGTKSS
ncbi:hypothetical protein M378DRAFT_83142 [Amanita muscaria Koide BX008]|uniref:DNA ligase n=1 Tax=Amanita muscaria (strain Koide BX008) TaxID=946122 RepID=A0A0C2WX91_AMAMK|nr:hypothetical protein M378DRAFT_83142 [Amanita muscaria Koide BX008]